MTNIELKAPNINLILKGRTSTVDLEEADLEGRRMGRIQDYNRGEVQESLYY